MIVNNALVSIPRLGRDRQRRLTSLPPAPEVKVVEPAEIIPPIDLRDAPVSRGFATSGRGPTGRARGLFLDILV